jgi:hypothetical protein
MPVGVLRHGQRAAHAFGRFDEIAGAAEQVAAVVERHGEGGVELPGALVGLHRALRIARLFERAAQVVVRLRVKGIELEGAPERADRVLHLALRLERAAEHVVECGDVAAQRDRLVQPVDRRARVAGLERQVPDRRQRFQVVGAVREYLLVGLERLRGLA